MTTGSVLPTPSITETIRRFWNLLMLDPGFRVRFMLTVSVFVLLLGPDLIAMARMLYDVLVPSAPIGLPDIPKFLFEGLVLFVVFAFASVIIWGTVKEQLYLQEAMLLIAGIVTCMSGVVMSIMTYRCMPGIAPETGCGFGKFLLAFSLVTFFNAIAYYIPKATKLPGSILALVFLAVSFLSSELWVLVAIFKQTPGIDPTPLAFRGLIVLIYALTWTAIFATIDLKKPEPPQPNRYRR